MNLSFGAALRPLSQVDDQRKTSTEVTYDPTGVVWKPVSKSRSVVFTRLSLVLFFTPRIQVGIGRGGVPDEWAIARNPGSGTARWYEEMK